MQRHLNSIRDVLARNGISYISVAYSFSISKTLKNSLKVPKTKKTLDSARLLIGKQTLKDIQEEQLAYKLFRQHNYPEALKIIDRQLAKTNSPLLYSIKGDILVKMGDCEAAAKVFKKAVRKFPKSELICGSAGNFFGEELLDFKTSCHFFEKAYKLVPSDGLNGLNYAESLVTVKKYQEGFNLARKVFNESRDLFLILAAYFIMVYALFLMGEEEEATTELANFEKLYSLSPSGVQKFFTRWVFNKLCVFLEEEIADKSIKNILMNTVKLIKMEISPDDYQQELKKFLKK